MKKSGESGKFSILSGMKIKASKELKYAAQTETNLNFSQKKQEEVKPVTRDDSDLKKNKSQQEYQPPLQVKEEETAFKKTVSKSPEMLVKPEKFKSMVEQVQNKTAEEIIIVKEPVQVPKNLVQTKKDQNEESRSSKSHKHSTDGSSMGVVKTSSSPRRYTRNDVKQKAADLPDKKKPEKPMSSKRSEQSFSTGRRPSAAQPEKVKKSDREQVIDEINQFTVKLVGVVILQREIKVQIAQTKAIIHESREKIAKWTSEQALCAEKEEYEQADRLQTEIEQAQKKAEELQIELGYMEDQVVKQEHEEVNLLKTQNSNMKRLSRKLKLVELQLQDEAANFKRDELQKIQTLKTRQDSERKKIVRIEKDIGYQSEQIGQFEKEFKKELNSKMDPLLEQKEDLETNKTSLESEIKELQRKLKEKRASLVQVVKELKTVHESIIDIENTFKDESQKLQERKAKLEMVENQRDDIQLTISDIDTSIENQTKCMDAKYDEKMAEARQLAELAKNIEQKQITFDDEVQARKVALDCFLLNANCAKQFESKHRVEKQKLKEIEYKKGTVNAEISKLQDRKEELKKKIPDLQIEQKKYADLKNFKAAGMKKGQIKDINEELASIKDRLENYLGEEHELEMEYEELNVSQKEANEEEAELQKNLAYSQVKYDYEKLKKLKEYLSSVQKTSGLSSKDKEKYIKALTLEIQRITQETKYFISHFELSVSPQQKMEEEHEEQNEYELEDRENETEELVKEEVQYGSMDRGDKQHIEEEKQHNEEEKQHNQEEEKHNEEEDQQEPKYVPLVIEGHGDPEPEQLQENEEGGYVPLQLD